MKSIPEKLLCMLLGGVLLGFNAGRLDGGIHSMLFIIGIALINFSIYGISKQIRRKKCGIRGAYSFDVGKQSRRTR